MIYGARSRCRSRSLLVGLAARDRRRRSARSPATSAASVDGLIMRTHRPRLRLPGDHPRDGRRRPSLGPGLQNAVLALVIVSWPAYARVVRGLVLSIGDSEYVAVRAPARRVGPPRRSCATCCRTSSARCSCSRRSTSATRAAALRPLVPRARRPAADRRVGRDGRRGRRLLPVLVDRARSPGLAIFTVVLAFNFLGDSLRDVFDPRVAARGRR